MNLITLQTVDSTNRYLKDLIRTESSLPNYLTIFTPRQTAGVGQYGAKWQSVPYMNLTFSTLFIPYNLTVDKAFLLNMLVPIAVVKTLKAYQDSPDIHIKWPNDILIANKKVGGILIENVLQGQQLVKSVIGIGINVNQGEFEGLPKASSLKILWGKELKVKHLLKAIVLNLEKELSALTSTSFQEIYPIYRDFLYRVDKVSTFRLPDGTHFMGIIKGVTSCGELVVETENNTEQFSLKEVELMY